MIKVWSFLCFLLIGLSLAEPARADEIEPLVKKLIQLSTPGSGVGTEMQDLSDEFDKLDHKKVVASVIPLLSHKNKRVVYHAGYVIMECADGVLPKQLDALINGYKNGSGWLPSVIGRIAQKGNAKAIRFLADDFRRKPQTQGQIDYTLIRLGAPAVPRLIHHFDEADLEKEASYFSGLEHLFRGMRNKAAGAVPHLSKVAKNDKTPTSRRCQAIMLLGCIGEAAVPALLDIQKILPKDNKNFYTTMQDALIATGTDQAAWIMVKKVEEGADHYTIRKIALLGESAKPVGPRLVQWLKTNRGEARAQTAAAIGAISYHKGSKALQNLLTEKNDWRVAYSAARALAKLKDPSAIPALKKASKDYWFPIVKDAATRAIAVIEGRAKPDKASGTKAGNLVGYTFVDRSHLSNEIKLPKELQTRIRSETKNERFHTFEQNHPKIAAKFIELRNTNGEEMLRRSNIQTLKVKQGTLLAMSAGEWTGGLQFLPNRGQQLLLHNGNIADIKKWNNSVYFTLGTYHMGMNEGTLHRIIFNDQGVSTEEIFVLPGCPYSINVTANDSLVVHCRGGIIAFSKNGDFKYYSRKK